MVAICDTRAGTTSSIPSCDPLCTRIETILASFQPIGLGEMEHVALLDRMDTKYMLRLSQLAQVLPHLTEQYRVLEVNATRLSHYQTLYLDTMDFALYRQHHNGLRTRCKVRLREYIDSELAVWEVKYKTNRGRTIKRRLPMPLASLDRAGAVDDFIDANAPFPARELEPKLWNRFTRITLVSLHSPERLTLDLNLEFGWHGAYACLPGIVVAEVKQVRCSHASDFICQMRELPARPLRFSKYCAGVCLLYDGVKSNNFKARLRFVHKLIQEERTHGYVC